ncbi:hypothetical protein DYB32_001514 [Aphanomyces invadans]|uniref:xanthine dehydrogenase n=1 Tax=Aphanomyces invadans TaxID=157072 RepID=A0A3R7D5K2_9STRA|nr:hypothetical protein DYB32_001514 [Aphanomyces invadans]
MEPALNELEKIEQFQSSYAGKQNQRAPPMEKGLLVYVNGDRVLVKDVEPEETLLDFLRIKQRLTGTKLGCGEGGCGACSVIVSRVDPTTQEVTHKAVNSCLTPVCAVEGCAVTTVEGLRKEDKTLHPVQKAIAEHHGSQCGFCTPGIVMALTAIVQDDAVTMDGIEHQLDGNLCRCTGYRPILDAARSFGSDALKLKCGSSACDQHCMTGDIEDILSVNIVSCSAKKIRAEAVKHMSARDFKLPQFPEELRMHALRMATTPTTIDGTTHTWHRPTSLLQLLYLKTIHPDAKLSVGHSEIGIEVKFKRFRYPQLIAVGHVPELNVLSLFQDASFHGIEVGAAVPLVRLDQFCKMHVVKTNVAIAPHHKRTFAAIRRMLKWFASVQIRNVASLGGNLATASPIGDMNPLLTAMGAKVELALENENSVSRRIVPLKEFFVSYRRVALAPTEVIVRVLIPLAKEQEFIFPFKQARRREDDISIVTAGMRVNLVPGDKDWHVDDISLVYGGMAATIKVPEATQQALRTAKTWNLTNVKAACNVLAVELALPVTVPGGMSAYRTTLSVSFLYKFYLEVVEALGRANPQDALWKGGLMTSKLEPSGSGTAVRAPVGHPLMHRSAYGQVSGEAKYVDDMDDVNHVLHGALVLSTVPHGDIVRIDASKALKMPGVVAFLDASVFNQDTFGHNELGPVIHDEECFASNRVVTVGQPLGIILAATHQQATAAADVVRLLWNMDMTITAVVFVACAAAVAAKALKRPVRLLVERSVDMLTSGTRHPYFAKYKAGATKDGKLLAYDVELFNNAGYSLDLSEAVMDRALFHCENAYFVPNVRAVGKCCKTNLPTNTAFRGFGAPQGTLIPSLLVDAVAMIEVHIPQDVREINLYKANMRTHFGQVLTDFHLDALWARALRESRYDERLAKVETFNRQNKWKKQGLSILPSKFGISFTNKFMNQGGSLVHVYSDGSVLVSHGGTEMGQGLHTKVIQIGTRLTGSIRETHRSFCIVAKAFGISCDDVTIHDTSTDKVANSQPSAASMSTDLYGMATLDACEQILERLKPVVAKLGPNATFAQVTRAAYFDRICLSAHGFFIVPGENCGYDWSKSVDENSATGQAFNYFTTGVCVTQVELDVLTGDTHMQTVDIYMDIGASINPAIDIGQIEGAFIQGFGLFCMEQHVWGDANHPWIPRGAFFTRGPGTYKIPAFNDVPLQFNVWLEPNMKNKLAVHSSKAIGEPPLFLGATAYFAIKAAIDAARLEHIGEDGGRSFQMLPSPLTPERARLAVQDALCVTTPIPYGCY